MGDPIVPSGINTDHEFVSTQDTSTPQNFDSNHEFNFPGNHEKSNINQSPVPEPPSFTMPKMPCKASLSGYLKGQKVRLWSDTKHEWMEGIVKNVFTASGSWDNFAVPTGVVQVESKFGVKFITPEQMSCLQRSVCSQAVEQIYAI